MASEININNSSSSSLTSPSSLQNPSSPESSSSHHHQEQSSVSIDDHLSCLSIDDDNGGKEKQKDDGSRGKLKDENVVVVEDGEERENYGGNCGGIEEANGDDNDNDAMSKDNEEERENSGGNCGGIKEANVVVQDDDDDNDAIRKDHEERENSGGNRDHVKEDNGVLQDDDDDDNDNDAMKKDNEEERENFGENCDYVKEDNGVLQDDDDNNNDNDVMRKGDEEERGKEWSRCRKGDYNGGGGGGGVRFPVRSNAEDCSFYVRTGCCKFGMNCKFNHPPNLLRRVQEGAKVNAKEDCIDSVAPNVKEKDESVEKEPIDCKYFDRPEGCKFGKACKFNHIRRINTTCKLNFMGLPIRPGEKECPFYMRNGTCKFGANCKFNHPEPSSIGASDALPGFNNGGPVFSPNASQSSYLAWSPPTPLKESPPYVPLIISPTQGVRPQPEWNSYQAPFYIPERSMKMAPTYAMNSQLTERPDQIVGDEYPERPGEPECSYFLKTGTCKYKSACKFHHPKRSMPQPPPCLLSDLGLPLRPGENVCSHYSRYGICKYGPACKYDHPINYAHSSNLNATKVDQTPNLVNSMVNNQAMVAGS